MAAPKPAHAGPVVGAVVSFATSIFGAGGFIATTLAGGGIGAFALRLGGSILLSAAARALGPKPPGAPELVRQFEAPQSLPAKRHVYGYARIYGSAAWRVGGLGASQGRLLFACMVLNSRPSWEVTGVYFDKEQVPIDGDIYDFAGEGGRASSGSRWAPWVHIWVGKGDQTAPPDLILSQAPGIFSDTDAGRGLTVMWLMLDCGPNDERSWRWPRTPPEVEVEGRWSRVWDLRDPAQDPANPATWGWSQNQALCALDALRTNPIRSYPLEQLDLASFVDAANVADQSVALREGGAEPRYSANGALIFSGSELMDQVLPLFSAGAAQPVRVGGRLSIAPGAFTALIATLTDITEAEGLSVRFLKPGRDLATTVHCTFTDPARDWRTSDLEDYTVPGAVAEDGGLPTVADLELPLVTSATQAMRIQKIRAKRQRAQRQISCTLPPSWFKVVAGANVVVDFPAPYAALNGLYRVTSANPGLFASEEGGGGVAMRVPVVMEEIAEADFAFDPATEEQSRALVALSVGRGPPAPGGAITTTTGAAVAIGSGVAAIAAVRFAFDPSPSASVQIYEWEYRLGSSGNPWQAGGAIDAELRDGGGQVAGLLTPVALGFDVTIRARAIGQAASDWVVSAPVAPTLDVARYEADFAGGAYRIDGATGTIANVLGLSRASVGSFVDAGGSIQTAAANVPRIDHAAGMPCLLIEAAATNLLTDSAVLSGQSVAVTAQPYTLSFRGTGTVTLTGASTAGPLVGTGASDLVSLTFTPSAGTLDLAVTGTVEFAQLEAGAAVTSWIPTTGAPASRAADVPSMQGVSGVMDVLATYDNGTTAAFDAASVLPGYWPTLTRPRLRSLIGTI